MARRINESTNILKGTLNEMKRLVFLAKEVSKEKGVYYVVYSAIIIALNRLLLNRLAVWYYRMFKSSTFTFRGTNYNYFYHTYNSTWKNERAIEIPIVWSIIEENRGKDILEVGNVLSHYFHVNHDILDKYEKAEGVINKDIVDFKTSKQYDLIASISTLEHVGWNEKPRESLKYELAVENLKRLLTPKGKIVITMPLGYNPVVDKSIEEGKIGFKELYCLKRISKGNRWVEVDWKNIRNIRYEYPFRSANGLVIGVFERD